MRDRYQSVVKSQLCRQRNSKSQELGNQHSTQLLFSAAEQRPLALEPICISKSRRKKKNHHEPEPRHKCPGKYSSALSISLRSIRIRMLSVISLNDLQGFHPHNPSLHGSRQLGPSAACLRVLLARGLRSKLMVAQFVFLYMNNAH
jgi:hypothetical protein